MAYSLTTKIPTRTKIFKTSRSNNLKSKTMTATGHTSPIPKMTTNINTHLKEGVSAAIEDFYYSQN